MPVSSARARWWLKLWRLLPGLAIVPGLALDASAAPRASHVFIISIDGGKPAVIRQSAMPVLRQLAAEGSHTWTAVTIFPSITLPSHTSMLTGLLPGKHHVDWNDWIPSRGLVQVPTIFSEARGAGKSTAMFVGKAKFLHLDLPGSLDLFEFDRSIDDATAKAMLNSTAAPLDSTVPAKRVAQNVADYLKSSRPALCFIHFTDTDNTGHKYGWGSPEQISAFADVDAALGVVMQAIRASGIAEDSVVIVTADHGGHDKTHGLSIPDDMNIPWIAWGKGVKSGFEITAPVTTCDTAATALWLLDLPLTTRLDGKPVACAFE